MGETNFLDGMVASVNGALVLVETAIGPLSAKSTSDTWQPAPGQACTVSIRPESWRLDTQRAAVNSVAGHLRDRVYLGEMAQYQFATGNAELRIYELNPKFVHASGERELFASAEPEDVIVLPR
jgi:iron(III) transport system ATP-binding protein